MNEQRKVAWITGASSGIGKALVGVFYRQGYNIILSSRREEALEKVALEYGMKKDEYSLLAFDLAHTCPNSGELAKKAVAFFNRVDVLVLNGGISQRMNVFDTDEPALRNIMEINFHASACLAKAMLPHFTERKTGQIIVMSSIAGKFGFYLRPAYCASKHALHGYFDTFRLETEPYGIKTLLVCPGKIKTEISKNALTKGGQHGIMDESHANAMSAEECAQKIFSAMQKGKEEVWIGRKEILLVYIKNYFPALFRKIIRKQNPY
ncbi:MAG: SDR family NAD(P)-dependent oxidoreductase [Bacteroidia bacterium]|nr:SDR family NAD(P)-dependent oxidoreductase [Bacteroidia bacterium]